MVRRHADSFMDLLFFVRTKRATTSGLPSHVKLRFRPRPNGDLALVLKSLGPYDGPWASKGASSSAAAAAAASG